MANTPAVDLADMLIGGVLKREIAPLLHTSSLLMEYLGTAMTMVDKDAFCVYPFQTVAEALDLDEVRVLRAPTTRMAAEREQWDDGNNVLAVAPGVVMGYECNTTTSHMLADNGIEVTPVRGSELGRGRGGPRCMTCPVVRDAVSS